jgi:hypothetical protein
MGQLYIFFDQNPVSQTTSHLLKNIVGNSTFKIMEKSEQKSLDIVPQMYRITMFQ